MSRKLSTPDRHHRGRKAAPATTAKASLVTSAGPIPKRQLEKSVSWSGLERLRCLWYQFRLDLADIHYANRRLIELQAPWVADPQWHAKAEYVALGQRARKRSAAAD